ncbi:WD40/YVTN repeat-like-containing domain,WD40-repeat-containing domain [Cinara cedri]|uniref:WD40/YVTN repeat-like-containing domain,WD40-repeat-containing domain n=1 Tax=Cinara cedri TaxID=506608 RepID=A0A5E4M9E7_9HEMI|nr:WD40/YVTN repeat-like-containing domain,WD40-repeat-containing domain [Cinara cedri]
MAEVYGQLFDDWLINSYNRYHKLQMFSLDKPVISMESSDNYSVCLACKKPEQDKYEVLNFEIPNKLFQLANEYDSINTRRDLKIKCGTLTNEPLIDMKPLYGMSKVILSEKGVGKISIYKMDFHQSDQMIPLRSIESKIDSGRLAVDITTSTIIIWGKENVYPIGDVYDIENNKRILAFENESNNPMCSYVPYFMSNNELVVLNSENGSFDLYDLTSGEHLDKINLPVTDNNAKWFSNTMYSSYKETSTFNLTLIANSGTLLNYDLRNCKIPTIHQKDCFTRCNNDININFDSCSVQTIAVNGFDGNVYIIEEKEIKGNKIIVRKFKHEGHLFNEEDDLGRSKIRTSSTLWLPKCGSNTLLSAADDGSVQGWQFLT